MTNYSTKPKKKKIANFRKMGFFGPLLQWRFLNRKETTQTPHPTHVPLIQWDHQEHFFIRKIWLKIDDYRDIWLIAATMRGNQQWRLSNRQDPLPRYLKKNLPNCSPSLIQEENALICWKWINSNQDRGNCVSHIPTATNSNTNAMTSTPALEMHRVIWPPTPSKNSVTGAFYDRVSGENQQIHNNDNYFWCRRKW